MHRAPSIRTTWTFYIGVLVVLLLQSIAFAAPLRVRVHGVAKLVARASREQVQPTAANGQTVNELVLSGSLTDDAGQPLAIQSVTIRVTSETDPHDAHVAEGVRHARVCDKAGMSKAWGVHVRGPTDDPEVVVITDEEGRFCFRARIDPARYKAHLVFAPTSGAALLDGIERDLSFDLTKRGLALRFDPTPRILQLDAPTTTIEGVAILDDDATPRVAPGLGLVLANETMELARGTTDAAGRARFILPGQRLGPPGAGELHLSFAGDADTSRASHSEEVARVAKVVVKVPAADNGELSAKVPEDGIPIVAEVGSIFGPVAEGSVEARIGDIVVGTAPVERGLARLTLTFASQGSEALVRLRYVPTAPWYEALGEPSIRIPIRGPSFLSKAPILLAGLAVLAFFLVGRVSAQRTKPEPLPPPVPSDGDRTPAEAGIEVRRAMRPNEGGWTGRVVDAHEGRPIRGVRVWIERGTFHGVTVLENAQTDAFGAFHLADIGPTAGDERMSAEGRLHARFTAPLPPTGELDITLVQRRRAMLAKLVAWARKRGHPFDVRPEPTPGHIKRAAAGDPATARWAEAVERKVFGPGEVDGGVEDAVTELAPEDARAIMGAEPVRPPIHDVEVRKSEGKLPRRPNS